MRGRPSVLTPKDHIVDRKSFQRIKWACLAASLAVCTLSYLHLIPLAYGMAFACLIPLVWAVEAYRDQKKLAFAVAATLLLVMALPLMRLIR